MTPHEYTRILQKIETAPSVECDCPTCKDMCANGHPCRPTPDEAEMMLEAGLAGKLYLEYNKVYRDGKYIDDVTLLKPAIQGEESTGGNSNTGRCTFVSSDGLCTIHNSGFKPVEARKAMCDEQESRLTDDEFDEHENTDVYELVKLSWNSDKGIELIKRWRKMVRYGAID